jgi:hypothetical protein
MGERLLNAYVGPVRPADYVRNRHRPRPKVPAAATGGAAVAGNLRQERPRGSLGELSGTSLRSLAQS